MIVLGMIMIFPFLDSPSSFLGSNELNDLQRMGIEDLHMLTTTLNTTGEISEKMFIDGLIPIIVQPVAEFCGLFDS